jgi:hypothetical protein
MTDQVITHSAAKTTIHAPVSPIDLTEWIFTLTDSEYQACSKNRPPSLPASSGFRKRSSMSRAPRSRTAIRSAQPAQS